MRISLSDWKRLEGIVADVKKVIEVADSQTFDILCQYHSVGDKAETELLAKLNRDIHDLRQQASLLLDCHPQSEWMGGDSDNPANHRLREPNCCPAPRRHFTAEEVAEAKLHCEGPCQWRSDT
jgi:hypothetical protein